MTKFDLCPPYCLYDPDDLNPGVQASCDGCPHSSDQMIVPPQEIEVLDVNKLWVLAYLVATNGNKLYIKEGDVVFTYPKQSPFVRRG